MTQIRIGESHSYFYMSMEATARGEAHRHESKGLWWTDQGMDEYAVGSFKKAARWHRKADALRMPLFKVWPIQEEAVTITIDGVQQSHDSETINLLKSNVDAAYAALRDDFTRALYGSGTQPKLSLRERAMRKAREIRQRIADAWAVLLGRAEIY